MKPVLLRPALKTGASDDSSCSTPFPFAYSSTLSGQSPHVHFPPTPILTSTALTHSPYVYDRAPIRVSPNSCALPERGDRTYGSDDELDSPAASSPAADSYFLPRRPEMMHSLQAWATDGRHSMLLEASHERYDISTSPCLVADVSSESEDSDQCGSPRPNASAKIPVVSVQLHGEPGGSSTYPWGGGISREQGDPALEHKNLATDYVALPFARKVKRQLETNADGTPRSKVKKEHPPMGERSRKLSGSRLYTSVAPSDFAEDSCLGGF